MYICSVPVQVKGDISNISIGSNFFAVRVVKHRNSFPREVVESLTMEILETQLDVVLNDRLWVTLL